MNSSNPPSKDSLYLDVPATPRRYSISSDSSAASTKEFIMDKETQNIDFTKKKKSKFKLSYLNIHQLLWLSKMMLREFCLMFLGTLGVIIISGVNLAIPYFVGRIVESKSERNPTEFLYQLLIILASFCVAQGVGTFVANYFFSIAGERIVAQLRKDLFNKIMIQDVSFFDVHSTGDLLNRLASDTKALEYVITIDIKKVGKLGVQLIGGIVMMFYQSWRLALVVFGGTPLVGASTYVQIDAYIIVAFVYGVLVKKISSKFQDALAAASSTADESIKNVRTVKSFVQEIRQIGQYSDKISKSYVMARWNAIGRASFAGFMALIGNFGFIGTVGFGGYMLIQRIMTIGELTSFLFYLIYIVNALSSLSELYYEVIRALGATERLFKLMQSKPVINVNSTGITPKQAEGTIEFRDVKFYYQSRPNNMVLNGFNLKVEKGKVYAFVGESGCGKTTTFSLLQRFYDVVDGAILVDGINVKNINLTYLRTQITTVSQEPSLFDATIAENIAYGKKHATKEEIIQAAKRANAHDFIMKFDKGYDTSVGECGKKLSAGQKQRIAIARALLLDPKILLLDECTSALDAESEAVVTKALEELIKGRTVLIIAHRLSTIKDADKICVVSNGSIIESGTHKELIELDGAYKKLVEHQELLSSSTDYTFIHEPQDKDFFENTTLQDGSFKHLNLSHKLKQMHANILDSQS